MTRQLEIKSFLIADYVTQDHSGKHIIVGVFDRIFSVEFPAQHNPAGIFFQFTDAEGEYQVKVQFVELQSKSSEATPEGECVLFELGTTIACDDPLSVGQVGLMIPGDGLPLPTEGAYEFRLYSNSDLVYNARLTAIKATKSDIDHMGADGDTDGDGDGEADGANFSV